MITKMKGTVMRRIAIVMLLLLTMTCVAFADENGDGSEELLQENQPQQEISLDEVTMTLDPATYEETGSAITPEPVLMYGAEQLVKETDYTLEYSNNTKPGTATVTAVFGPDGRFEEGTKSVNFTITAKPALIDLSKVSMALSKTSYYKTGKAITPAPVLKYGSETLAKGTDYTLKYSNNTNAGTATVTAVFSTGARFAKGSKSVNFTILPAKPKAAAITKVKSKKPKVIVTWKKVSCTGYELQVSASSKYKDPAKYKLGGVSKSIGKLKNKKTYYFRVRPYNTENGKTTYGDWSTYSSKVKTTGVVGKKYSRNGAYIKDKTIKLSGNYYYYNKSGNRSGCSRTMWNKVKNASSGTKYLIAVDCTKNRVCIYKKKDGNWALKSYWKCTTGARATPTIKGSFRVKGKVSHFGEPLGYSVWYATRIQYEYYFHSILYRPYSKSSVISGTLGKNLSHGCIRLNINNARWIYNNCRNGTKIIIY